MSEFAERAGIAVFYPNLRGMINVRISNGEIQATTDSGTACSELRHFIDATTLSELEGGSELMASMIAPEPRVTRMMDRGNGGQTVLGMLSKLLTVQIDTSDGRRIEVKLEDVLVIVKFNVPLHISIKRFKAGDANNSNQALGTLVNCLPGTSYCAAELPFEASSLPERFHQLPYWRTDCMFIGDSGDSRNEKRMYDLLAARAGKAGDLVKFVV